MGAVEWAVDFLFPPTCAGCDQRCEEPGFCPACSADIERPIASRCPRCGRAFHSGESHLCAACLAQPPTFGRLWACAGYSRGHAEAPLSRAIRRLKYDRDSSYAGPLSGMLTALLRDLCDYDAIVPVPLHISRLRWRGFNQATLLARPLARRCRIPLETHALRRVRPTVPQVGLGESERRRNIAGAFEIRRPAALRKRRILLVDDVYTTGATVEECARVLLRGDAAAVDVAVLARAR